MSWDELARIEVDGVDGSHWVLNGDGAGAQGVHLGSSPKGIYDAPVKTAWLRTSFGEGAVPAGPVRFEPRDIVFTAIVQATAGRSWQHADSAWRRAWAYDRDAVLRVQTPLSGMRELKVRLFEAPSMAPDFDPHRDGYSELVMTVRAGDPFWRSEPDSQAVTLTGTAPSAAVTVSNPTDREMWLRWVLEPGLRWGVPDGLSGRTVWLPTSLGSDTVVVDTHPLHEQIVVPGKPNAWQAMGGVQFVSAVPAYTPPTQVTVRATGALGSSKASATVFCDRRWTRPWGLE